MNIIRNDRVVLTKEVDNMKTVGETYEVANITTNAVVLRDVASKVAVGAIDIDEFDQYFKKADEVKGWTNWNRLVANNGDIVGFYRTNYKKVQVRTNDNIRAEASKHKDDEFNLFFGLQLASIRCANKALRKMELEHENSLKEIRSIMAKNNNHIKKMLNSLVEKGE